MLLTRNVSITEAAFSVGFEDVSTFSRAFKNRFGCSASAWKKGKNSKINQEISSSFNYDYNRMNGRQNIIPEDIGLFDFSSELMLYKCYTGSFSGNYNIFQRLHRDVMNKIEKYSIDWKRGRGFFAVYHDSMGITEEPRLRLSYGVLLSGSFTPDRSLGTMQIPENKYIIADFLVGNNDYGRAWTSMFTEIILSKGYEPADGFCFENYFEDCYNGQTGKTRGSIGVPVIKI